MASNDINSEQVREIELKSRQIMDEIGQLLERLNRRLAGEKLAQRPAQPPPLLN
jgi:hypothetical protein